MVETLQVLGGLRELRISGVKALDQDTRKILRSVKFDLIEILVVREMPDAALFIRACPKITTFKSDFPCNKVKTTFKALLGSTAVNLELENQKAWRSKHLEGEQLIVLILALTVSFQTSMNSWARSPNSVSRANSRLDSRQAPISSLPPAKHMLMN